MGRVSDKRNTDASDNREFNTSRARSFTRTAVQQCWTRWCCFLYRMKPLSGLAIVIVFSSATTWAQERSPWCGAVPKGVDCWYEISDLYCDIWIGGTMYGGMGFAFVQTQDVFRWSGDCRNGAAHGRGQLTHESGWETITHTGEMFEGKFHGYWSYVHKRHSGGELEQTAPSHGLYEHGERYGYWELGESYSGRITGKGRYVNGRRHGLWFFFHGINDNLSGKGAFVDGKRHGQWTYFDYDGNLEQQITYVNGQIHGTRISYNKDGSIRESQEYRNGELVR